MQTHLTASSCQWAVFLSAILLLAPRPTWADDWPQFRGPDGQGHAATTGAPLNWSETEGVAWKVALPGRGWSSPVVAADGTVWLTAAIESPGSAEELKTAVNRVGAPVPSPFVAGQVTLCLIGVAAETGQIAQNVELFSDDDPIVLNSMNSYASPTAVMGHGYIFCDFGSLGTACVEAESGRVAWTRQLAVEHQVGPGSSPILFDDLLILTRDGCDQQYVTGLDARTGKTVWKTDRPVHDTATEVFRKAFSTPLVFSWQGETQMVVPGAQWIVSYEPRTGKELWRVDTGATFSNTSRPVFSDGKVYICTAYGGTFMEAIRVDGRGDVTQTHVLWRQERNTPRRSSPILVNNRLYFVSDRGIAGCVNADDGQIVWNERFSGANSASPVCAEGRVYFFLEDGVTTVIHTGDQFERIAENRLDGRIMASPAFVDGAIYLRTETSLYRIGE